VTRLFDSSGSRSAPSREGAENAASEALAAADHDEHARDLGARLGRASSVEPVHYARERRGAWTIEHGRAGDDYLFHLHPLRTLARPWQDIVTAFIVVMDGIFPRSVQIHYRRPDEHWQIKFFTIRTAGVCRVPAWETAVRKTLEALGQVATS
jgi:hypothetical protein